MNIGEKLVLDKSWLVKVGRGVGNTINYDHCVLSRARAM